MLAWWDRFEEAFGRYIGIIYRPCGCLIKSPREIPSNLYSLLYGWRHGRAYWRWDGFFNADGSFNDDYLP